MSIPPNSPARGCAANFPQPVGQNEMVAANDLVNLVQRINLDAGLEEVVQTKRLRIRSTYDGPWSAGTRGPTKTSSSMASKQGLKETLPTPPTTTWITSSTAQEHHLTQLGVPHTPSSAPLLITIGIPTLRHVSFVREIKLIINGHFNPQAHPYAEVIIYLPIHIYEDENGVERNLPEETYPPRNSGSRYKREISESDDNNNDAAYEWYTHKVIDVPSYINAAFRASSNNEAYLFMKNKYVLVNYAPGSTDDRIVNGPLRVCDGFPSLIDTPFGEYGIDCAFDTDYNEAFIFCANLCALIDYAPGTTDDKILSSIMPIASMFPLFKGTVFENGIDAAFKATSNYEAYLFRHEKYALVNYNSKTLIAIRNITDGFPSLMGTVFASDIDAVFASHRTDEAYIFKGELYALINFAPGTTDDYIVGTTIKEILPNWACLRGVLPLMNRGLDSHHHHGHGQDHHPDHRHDELK